VPRAERAIRCLPQGNVIKMERLSYRSFQKAFGRSVKRRAPGPLISIRKRKAARTGARVIAFPTRTPRLPQFSYETGDYKKRLLSQRFHAFADGSRVRRPLYSAWLARFVEQDRRDASPCGEHRAAAEPRLHGDGPTDPVARARAVESFPDTARRIPWH
jgi:putative transposase